MPATDPEQVRSSLERTLTPQWVLRPSAHFGAAGAAGPLTVRPAPVPARRPPRPWRSKQQLSSRATAVSAWIGFLAALALPIAAWHHQMSDVASRFRIEFGYLVTGWSGYLLILAGLAMMAPVVLSAGRAPDSRLRPLHRGAYLTWGIVLYLLGLALASQVAAIAG